jgi:hypothetical protein
LDNNNDSNGKEESSQEIKTSKQEKNILKINTKDRKAIQKAKDKTPLSATKFIDTDKIDPKYVEQLEDEHEKLKLHALMIMTKFGEIVQFIQNVRQYMSESGFAMQAQARENMDILNIKDKRYDAQWLMEQIRAPNPDGKASR